MREVFVEDGLDFARAPGGFDPDRGTVCIRELAEHARFLTPSGKTEGMVVEPHDPRSGWVVVVLGIMSGERPSPAKHRVPIKVRGDLRVRPLPRGQA